jgi:hypothetical protein
VVAIVLLVTFQLWISLTHQPIPDRMDRLPVSDTDTDGQSAATTRDEQLLTPIIASPAASAAAKQRRPKVSVQQWRHEWKPRVVFCTSDDSWTCSRNESSLALSSFSDNNNNSNNNNTVSIHVRTVERLGGPCPYCEHEPDFHVWPFELPFIEQCTPMVPWQTHFYPVCNSMHELDLRVVDSNTNEDNEVNDNDDHIRISLLSMKGSWRSVWTVLGGGEPLENRLPLRYRLHHNITVNNTKAGSIPQAVLKMLKFTSREFDHESFQYHQVDAMAMERLTASPHIVDSYGFCGQSVLTEWAPISARDRVKHQLTSAERLFMGRELAQALADVHSIDYKNGIDNATLTHNDLNMANVVVSLDGRLKLNDFNIGVLMRWNASQSQPCGYPARFHNPLWKSPEEIRNTSYVNPALSDVYSLGNLLFYIMTKHQPWTHLEPSGAVVAEEVGRRKLKGILPTFPDRFVATNKTATQAMLYAVLSCYRTNPAERLTARELAAAMDIALQWVHVGAKAPRRDVMQLFDKHPRKHKKRKKHH